MERESADGEPITRLLLGADENAIGNGEVVLGDSSSSVTVTLYLSTMVAVCGTFGTGCSAGYSSQAESGIMEDLGLTVAEYSVFGSTMTVGGMIGAIICGKLMDLFGRKGAMWFAEGFCFMGWLAIAFSLGVWLLYLGRLSLGIGSAVLLYVVPVYIAEISPKYFRGGFVALIPFVFCCGMSTILFVGNMINWRLLALIGAIPPSLQFLGLFLIPESPRWLAKIGLEEGCKSIIQRLRGENADITQEVSDIKVYIESLKLHPGNRFLDVFQRKYACALLVGVGLVALQQLSGEKGITYYASSIFTTAGFSSAIGTTAMAVIQILSTGLAIPLMDRLGRRPLLLASAVGTCFACLLIGMSFLFEDFQWWNDTTPTLVFIGILIFIASFTFGMSGVPWAIMSEIFPINIKASAGSLANATSWFLSWVVSYSFNFMMEWSSTGTFFIFACFCGFAVLFVAKLVPETRGRTLEEIQVAVTRSSHEESSAEAF